MTTPAHFQKSNVFYPFGNTPAVCLTQSLPFDQDVTLLLLGCGDPRSILFTVYAGLGSRKLDFTCCDSDPEILARNILLFTLLLEDKEGKNIRQIWDLFYHIYLDDKPLVLLRKHIADLKTVADTAEEWNQGKYGHILRFADSHTFSKVQELWDLYALPSGQSFRDQQKVLESSLLKAHKLEEEMIGDRIVTSGFRSIAPYGSLKSYNEVANTHRYYWEYGAVAPNQIDEGPNTYYNPLFGSINHRLVLDYCADPILGYHTATSHASLVARSPLRSADVNESALAKFFRAALDQFRTYAETLRKSTDKIRIRFVNADALAFCHTLQHLREYGDSRSAWWYRNRQGFTPLVLDSCDYSIEDGQSAAPLLFDTINSSNLVDHFGCLNLLAAVGPLLNAKATSSLSTEILTLPIEYAEEYVKGLVGKDLASVALLFGLKPTQYWTGTAATSVTEDEMSYEWKTHAFKQRDSRLRFILLWRSLGMDLFNYRGEGRPILSLDPLQLANLAYGIYSKMFQDEKPSQLEDQTLDELLRSGPENYTRSSFVAILVLIYRSASVDWDIFLSELHRLISEDSISGLSWLYMHQIFLHLRLTGLRIPSAMIFPEELFSEKETLTNRAESPFKAWDNIPSQVCLTLVVPREKLAALNAALPSANSPVAQVYLQGPEAQKRKAFFDIQIGFGRLKTTGTQYTNSFGVEVEEDPLGWEGSDPLIVSGMIHTYLLFLQPDLSTEVVFGLKATPLAVLRFSALGDDFALHRTSLANNDVFITEYRPNMSGHMSLSTKSNPQPTRTELPPMEPMDNSIATGTRANDSRVRFHAMLSPTEDSKITTITTHVDILPGFALDCLRRGDSLKVYQIAPFEVSIMFHSGLIIRNVRFPAPIQMSGSKTKVGRRSGYIEFTATVPQRDKHFSGPQSLYMVHLERGTPVVCEPHYLLLDRLPIFDVTSHGSLDWIGTHIPDSFSQRERRERERCVQAFTLIESLRGRFKDTLVNLFLTFTGHLSRSSFLMLVHKDNIEEPAFILFPSALRLDMSNQTVVLDTAVIAVTTQSRDRLYPLLKELDGANMRPIDNEEISAWKYALPALVERCRHWKHRPSCEYLVTGKIPLSTEHGQQTLCSCGEGRFPDSYQVEATELWKFARKHAVRAAISPCFSVPFIEKSAVADSGAADPAKNQFIQEAAKEYEDLRSRRGACFKCGNREAVNGGVLLACGKCKVAHYCSRDCQVADWREAHKDICKKFVRLL